jgi:hypothetical protein
LNLCPLIVHKSDARVRVRYRVRGGQIIQAHNRYFTTHNEL